ncbi:MAG: glycosyltransferase [Pseudoflavonifractor sp.]
MIPKIIHYCWFGGKPLPESAEVCIASWRRFCPDYQIKQWDETNFDVTAHPYTKRAYEAQKWAFVTDYVRLCALYDEGGIYLDTDVELVRCWDDLLDCSGFIGFEKSGVPRKRVNTGQGFGAEPGLAALGAIKTQYEQAEFRFEGGAQMKTTLDFFTDYLEAQGLRCEDRLQQAGGFTVYPTDYFCPKDGNYGAITLTPNTHSIHHFDASWFGAREQKVLLRGKKLCGIFGVKIGRTLNSLLANFEAGGIRGVLAKLKKSI